ncbi:CLUMA_CG014293, isoform C [Clunio marinus]|uniref:CLUMA_CG014293, isoform C n=1 Tax=Clunio marinus TaxID=568069 RepID=A0A1J1IMB5_9DIPT|nr:CLUMA_CG014293, isoform C [Clunio marinus]
MFHKLMLKKIFLFLLIISCFFLLFLYLWTSYSLSFKERYIRPDNFLPLFNTRTTKNKYDFDENIVVIYNRVPKTASTSFVNLTYDLCRKNHFHVLHINITGNNHVLSLPNQMKFARNITAWVEMKPAFYHGHMAFLDFSKFGMPEKPLYINIIRKPLDRLVSYYYFLRYGDDYRPHLVRHRAGDTMSFDECVKLKKPDCDPKNMWLQIPFFCGHHAECFEAGSEWALEQAKKNLVNEYFLVGTTEDLGDFIEMLELSLPRLFQGFYTMLSELDDLPSIKLGDFTLRFELDELTPFGKEVAEKELRESPVNKENGIKELKRMLQQETDLVVPIDNDDWMVRFLRPCKYYPESALELIKRYYSFKIKHHDVYYGLMPSKEENIFKANILTVFPQRDQLGRRILLLELGKKWKHKEVSLDEVFKGCVLFLEAAMLEPETQVNGAVVIFDMDGLSLQQCWQFTPPFAKRIVDWLQDSVPLRIKGIHIVNQPKIFNMVFALFKPFLREKLRNRIIFQAMTETHFINILHQSEKELVEFLAEEIVAERKAQKKKTLPSEIDGFKVKLDGADVDFVKDLGNEKVSVSFNVNHTVDTEEEPDINMEQDKPELGEMKSKPSFEVEIQKGNKTLSFSCSFLQGEAQEGEYNDMFGIDEVTIYEGEWNEKVYAVAGDVLDGYLYDLLMNYLEEKGVSNEFAEKLSDFSTGYEHQSYISLLESLSKFAVDSK